MTLSLRYKYQSSLEQTKLAEERLAISKEKETATIAQLAKLESKRVEIQKEIDAADPEINKLNEEITKLREQIASCEVQITNASELIKGGDKQYLELKESLAQDHQNVETIRTQYTEVQESLGAEKQSVEDIEGELDEVSYQLDQNESELHAALTDIDQNKAKIAEATRVIDSLKIRSESAIRQREKYEQQKNDIINRTSSAQTEFSQKKILMDAAELKVASFKRKVDDHIVEKRELENRATALEEEIAQTRASQAEIKESLLEKQSYVKSLVEIAEKQSNTAQLISNLRKLLNQSSITATVLSDKISFNEAALTELSPSARAIFDKWSTRILLNSSEDLEKASKMIAEINLGEVPAYLANNVPPRTAHAEIDAPRFTDFLTIDSEATNVQELCRTIFYLESFDQYLDLKKNYKEDSQPSQQTVISSFENKNFSGRPERRRPDEGYHRKIRKRNKSS